MMCTRCVQRSEENRHVCLEMLSAAATLPVHKTLHIAGMQKEALGLGAAIPPRLVRIRSKRPPLITPFLSWSLRREGTDAQCVLETGSNDVYHGSCGT